MITLDRVTEIESRLIRSKPQIDPSPKQEAIPEANHHNGRLAIIDGVAYKISCPRFEECLGPTYNQGYIKYFCSEEHHQLCPTENPAVCEHENFASIGHTAKKYKEYNQR
jgi:hypothetical protein